MIRQARSQKTILLAFNAISFALLLIFALVIIQQAKKTENYGDWVVHSYELLRKAHQVENSIFDLESSYRGYFLTDKKVFLKNVPHLQETVQKTLSTMRDMTKDSPLQLKNVTILEDLFNQFNALHQTHVQAYLERGRSGLSEQEVVRTRQMMAALQSQLNDFTTAELKKLERRTYLSKREQKAHMSTINTGAVIAVIGLAMAGGIIVLLLSRGAKTARKLEDVEELFHLIQDNLNDGYYEYDPVRHKITLSHSYRDQLGYDADLPDDVEHGFNELIHPDDRQRVWDEINLYVTRQIPEYSLSYRLLHADGTWFWVLSRAVGIWNDQGECIRFVGVHTDINEQKKQEEALRELNSELESFTYIASHDLRSPLVNLKGFAKEIENTLEDCRPLHQRLFAKAPENEAKILKKAFESDIPESLNFIHGAVEKMDLLTSAILNLSRIGRRTYRAVPVNMNELIKRCVENLNYEITSKNASVKVADLPEVYADQLAVDQVFSNVIDNAVKYLDPDRPGEIRINARTTSTEVIFSIEDNGRGISPEDNAKIFDIFRRARNTADVRGVGMGLAFVRTTIRKLGGRIWYKSELNKGTVFYIALPKPKQDDLDV